MLSALTALHSIDWPIVLMGPVLILAYRLGCRLGRRQVRDTIPDNAIDPDADVIIYGPSAGDWR